MPRKEAAERYSPPIADALSRGLTDRDATKKSLVVREKRSPQVPIASVVTVTARTAIRPGRASALIGASLGGPSTRSAKSRSLRSTLRT